MKTALILIVCLLAGCGGSASNEPFAPECANAAAAVAFAACAPASAPTCTPHPGGGCQ